MKKFFALSIFFFLFVFFIPYSDAQSKTATLVSPGAIAAFPDFLAVRSEFLATAITVIPQKAIAFTPQTRNSPAGRVQVSVERDGDYFYVLFLRERDGGFPLTTRGNMIFKRDVAKGFVSRLIWYLSDDGLSYISLTPKNERTLIDFVVGGAVVRSSYMVSALIYEIFTKPFSFLYNLSAGALDWAMVLGNYDSSANKNAASFAESLGQSKLTNVATAFFNAGADFSEVWRYLALSSNSQEQPVEVIDAKYQRLARIRDARDPDVIQTKPWSEQQGLAVESLVPLIIEGIDKQTAFIAIIDANANNPSRKLAIVPYRAEDGSYIITAYDALTGKKVDIASIVKLMAGSYARLFALPLPK